MALAQKPAQMIGNYRASGASGSRRAKPSTRRLTIALIPTSIAVPTVCMNAMPGYAHRELLSRTHVQKAEYSIVESSFTRLIRRSRME